MKGIFVNKIGIKKKAFAGNLAWIKEFGLVWFKEFEAEVQILSEQSQISGLIFCAGLFVSVHLLNEIVSAHLT